MQAGIWPHRVLPSLGEQRMEAENHPMLRAPSPDLRLRAPRGQRVPAAQLVLEQEMRQAQGRRGRRR